MLTVEDKEFLKGKGISEEKVNEQLDCFKKGFPFLKLSSAASTENGIVSVDKEKQEYYLKAWETYIKGDSKVMKFVPASGAASRMFKNLFAFLEGTGEPETDFEKTFFDNLEKFAFYEDLDGACKKISGKTANELKNNRQFKTIVEALLGTEGLNYGFLPKGLLKFHRYDKCSRTPMEEHLVEGALYSVNKQGEVNVHYTVSPQHRELFEAMANDKKATYESKYGVTYNISFSEQKQSTDTIAVDKDNNPFREDNGKILFRPGGHGALIENLNDLDADIVFIKNIDNVTSDKMKGDTVLFKKIIAGVLITLQQQVFSYLKLLESGKYTHEQVLGILQFLQKQLFCKKPDTKDLEDTALVVYLKNKLNRPMRVCGMVKNVGEPGGGPFLAYNNDGTISLQILESSQIDMNDPIKKEMFEKGTHFNPVDLVCAIKDYKGNKFDLTKYVDKATGFISNKSKNGRELKALELPGLWNGAMSDWNTVFVEVPLSTFNPVKVVNDLLREQHQ